MFIKDYWRKFLTFILPTLFGLYVILTGIVGEIDTYRLSFKGVIEKVRYSEPKHSAFPTINGKEYDLIYSSCESMDTLAVGDSIVKEKGFMYYRLFKK